MGLSIYDERLPLVTSKSITITDGTAYTTIVPAQPTPYRVDALLVSLYGTPETTANFAILVGTVQCKMGSFVVPGNSGFGGNPPVDLVTQLAPPAIGAFIVPAGGALQIAASPTLGAAQELIAVSLGGYV